MGAWTLQRQTGRLGHVEGVEFRLQFAPLRAQFADARLVVGHHGASPVGQGAGGAVAGHGAGGHRLAAGLAALTRHVGVDLGHARHHLGAPGMHGPGGGGRVGVDLLHAGPRERVLPPHAIDAVALVLGARGCRLAAEAVARVEPPAPPEVAYPWGGVVNHHRLPRPVGVGADAHAIAAVVVHERHAESGLECGVGGPGEDLAPHSAEALEEAADERRVNAHEFVCPPGTVRVRPRTRVGHDVRPVPLQIGVVHPTSQGIALAVV